MKTYLGASLPGDAEYKEEPVMEIEVSNAELSTSFDSAGQWLQCTVITNVHDQPAHGSCWAFGSVASFESRACVATGKDTKYSLGVTFTIDANGILNIDTQDPQAGLAPEANAYEFKSDGVVEMLEKLLDNFIERVEFGACVKLSRSLPCLKARYVLMSSTVTGLTLAT